MNSAVIEQLNNAAKNLGVEQEAIFSDGDAVSVARKIAPFGKVAAIYTKDSFLSFGKSFTETLKKAGINPLNFIMPDGFSLNFENVFDIIGVPEDVRAIICFDDGIKGLAAYIATLFKIPVIYVLRSAKTEGILASRIPFRRGNSFDNFNVKCERRVVIDFNNIEKTSESLSEQYVSVAAKVLALADFRVYLQLHGGRSEKTAYDAIKGAVINRFKPLSNDENTVATELLSDGLVAELADLSSRGAITENSAVKSFARLNSFAYERGLAFTLFKKLINLYAFCAKEQDEPFAVPDYNARVAELAEITRSDDGVFLKGLTRQLNYLRLAGDGVQMCRKSFSAEFSAQLKAFSTIEKNYTALGGKTDFDFSPYVGALKLSGDLPSTLNFMTLIRESGLIEFI